MTRGWKILIVLMYLLTTAACWVRQELINERNLHMWDLQIEFDKNLNKVLHDHNRQV